LSTLGATVAPRIAWEWSRFGLGLVLAAPAAIVIAIDTQLGLGMAVGMLPAAASGLAPSRKARIVSFVLSVVAALSLAIGALLGVNAVVSVVGLFLLCLGASVAASRVRAGALALRLAVPLMGMGLSFEVGSVLPVVGVMALSGLYAWLVSLLWPERPTPSPGSRPGSLPRSQAVTYGVLLGLAAATAALIGFGFDLDHKGWVVGATLLVMRPITGDLVARGLGRAGSVFVGGFLGSVFVSLSPSAIAMAIGVGVVVALMTATTSSRWYVTPAFTTFVVFVLLLWDHPSDTAWRFGERNAETILGIVIALFFGVLVPLVLRRIAPPKQLRSGPASTVDGSS
jgi:hypothetical protein